ncbi:MAG: glycosyltransferase [Woeseiaceae bacterium]
MSNILVITPWLPWPPHDGGRIRILEMLRHLSERHRVTLFAHIHDESERAHVAALRDFCADVQVAVISGRSHRRIGRMIGASLAGVPLIQGMHFDAGFAQRIAAATVQQKFDIVHVEFSLIARYAASVSRRPGSKLVLSTHNIESQRFARELELSSWGFRRLVLQADRLLFGDWEKKTVRQFDGAIAVSELDRRWLEA